MVAPRLTVLPKPSSSRKIGPECANATVPGWRQQIRNMAPLCRILLVPTSRTSGMACAAACRQCRHAESSEISKTYLPRESDEKCKVRDHGRRGCLKCKHSNRAGSVTSRSCKPCCMRTRSPASRFTGAGTVATVASIGKSNRLGKPRQSSRGNPGKFGGCANALSVTYRSPVRSVRADLIHRQNRINYLAGSWVPLRVALAKTIGNVALRIANYFCHYYRSCPIEFTNPSD